MKKIHEVTNDIYEDIARNELAETGILLPRVIMLDNDLELKAQIPIVDDSPVEYQQSLDYIKTAYEKVEPYLMVVINDYQDEAKQVPQDGEKPGSIHIHGKLCIHVATDYGESYTWTTDYVLDDGELIIFYERCERGHECEILEHLRTCEISSISCNNAQPAASVA